MYYLFLDDIRTPQQVTYINLPLYNWTIVRNYDEFVQTIAEKGLPEFITFDHDLGMEHYQLYRYMVENNHANFPYHKCVEKTGLDCAKWLIEYCMDNNLRLPGFTCHSMNPVGKTNIMSLLTKFKQQQ